MKPAPFGGREDNGGRFEVHAIDGYGRDILVGYTNRAGGDDLVRLVKCHSVWHSPRVIDREAQPHITNAKERA